MQWWIRPGPRRPCEISKPRPGPRMMLSLGTLTSSSLTRIWPCGASSILKTFKGLTMFTPGVSSGTKICDCWRCLGASGSVLTMQIMILQRGSPAPDVQCFSPLITHSSPSNLAEVQMLVASEEATSGSVMPKQERISPAKSGSSHCFFCASLPYLCKTSMLPVSGAEHLKISAANRDLPISSAR